MGFRDRGIEIKTPDQIAQDAGRRAARRGDPRAAARRRSRRASPPASSTRSPRTTSAPAAASRRSWATASRRSRPRSAPRSTTRSCTASPATGPCRRRRDLDRLRRHRRRLARRRRDHGRRRRGARRGARADAGDRGARCGPASPPHASVAGSPTSRTPSRPTSAAAGRHYGILEDFTGHGIGTAMHQPPNVPNYGRPGRGPEARARAGPGGRADGDARQPHTACSTTTSGRS